METDRIVARREPPADFGLSACLRRNADEMYCLHKNKYAQLQTIHPSFTSSAKCRSRAINPNGSAHTFSMVALPATTVKEFYYMYCLQHQRYDIFPK